ncbi:regulatory protein RecX [Thalassotalea sp. G2M2-11]|uniref:regulatory protein RecX n=1 Tax=Thalassotalea sp. G2M2-11 TaxID=2787627 RepID=UPI0019D12813|nr:regulatory protein RecX [Thalassotalea sp. G2M2-11]
MILGVEGLNKALLHKAIDLLSRREHSIVELTNKLRQREYQADDIDTVISFLLDNDYLSEQRFAESVFRSRINKGYGRRYIETELQQKGVNSSIIALAEEQTDIDWYHQARQSYLKKFNGSDIKDQKDKAKRIRFLQYRGFSTDEIFSVLNLDVQSE